MGYAQIANPTGLQSFKNQLNFNHSCLYHLRIHKDFKHSAISYMNNTIKDTKKNKKDSIIFDEGYYNHKVFSDFCCENILFVSRLKEDACYGVVESCKTEAYQIIKFTGVQTSKNVHISFVS